MGKIIENYSLQHELGSGVYSRVYKAINLKTKQDVAIKMVKAEKFKELPKLEQGTVNEINILTNLQYCPHIIRYYDMLKTVNNFYFVYEYCNGGTLQSLLKKQGPLSEKQALQYFSQIVDAFKVLNKNNIMHRDLKPDNILIHDGILKLADFGFCKPLENQQDTTKTMLGSPIYMAPEILKGQTYTIKADIWSLGVVLFRMLYGYCPFESNNIGQLIIKIDKEQMVIPPKPQISPKLAGLLKKMLTKNPTLRIDWSEIFSYEIKNGDILSSGIMKLSKTMTDSGNKSSLSPTTESSTVSKNQYTSYSQKEIPKSAFGSGIEKHPIQKNQPTRMQLSKPQTRQQLLYAPKDPYLRATYTTKSPIRQNIKKDIMLKNHSKCIQLTTMITFLLRYECTDSLVLAYFFVTSVQKQLLGIMQSIRKEGGGFNVQDDFFKNFSIAVEQELAEMKKNLEMIQDQIKSHHQPHLPTLQPRRRQYLKRFINSLRFDNLNELVMASRVVDLLQDSLFIRKETYERMSREQLMKKIRDKMQLIPE